jgi:F-type H+-transporting ATPase subunit delta
MSSSSLVAKKYANALFQVAKEKAVVAEVEQNLKLVSLAMKANGQLQALLSHPAFDMKVKSVLLKKVFGDYVHSTVLDTLQLMCDRRRTGQIDELATHFSKSAGYDLGQADAEVVSAKPMSDKDLIEIAKQFTEILGKEVRLTQSVNPGLIGGIQVRVGDTLYDGSISGKLSRLQKTLQES